MNNLKYGDMLWLRHNTYGDTVYMVVNSPIVCEHCNKTILDWELNEENKFFCPKCMEEINHFALKKCECGEYDIVSLIIACNNNFGYTSDGEMIPYNSMVNRIFSFCKKSIEKDIKSGALKLLSAQEAIQRKRLLVWTSQENYEPGTPMPQWIIDRFPDEV